MKVPREKPKNRHDSSAPPIFTIRPCRKPDQNGGHEFVNPSAKLPLDSRIFFHGIAWLPTRPTCPYDATRPHRFWSSAGSSTQLPAKILYWSDTNLRTFCTQHIAYFQKLFPSGSRSKWSPISMPSASRKISRVRAGSRTEKWVEKCAIDRYLRRHSLQNKVAIARAGFCPR